MEVNRYKKMETTSFKPTEKQPSFKCFVSNHDEHITVNSHHQYYGGAVRFGVLLTPKNPLDMGEMCQWLTDQGMPTDIKDCSEFGIKHPNGVFIYNRQVNEVDGQDYIYFVDVIFKPSPSTGINYPEVTIEGFKY